MREVTVLLAQQLAITTSTGTYRIRLNFENKMKAPFSLKELDDENQLIYRLSGVRILSHLKTYVLKLLKLFMIFTFSNYQTC
jgi:hypothetical protein